MARRVKVLKALDTARTQYYHFKAIVIAGMGLFTDAYDLFCIAPVTILISHIYYDAKDHYRIPPLVLSALVGVTLVGTVIGQLVFGRLGDLLGRRRVYSVSLALMVITSLGSGFSICTTSRTCVLASLGLFRFLLGLGIGGDFPLSATIMSEFSNKHTRGAFIAAVSSMQGFGILFSCMVIMIVCTIFDRATNASPDYTPKAADLAWRIILMIGSVPAAITFYWRMKMPESPRYTALVAHNVVQAAEDMEEVLEVSMSQFTEDDSVVSLGSNSGTPQPLSQSDSLTNYPLLSKQFLHYHGRDLFSCAITWFLVDIVFYSSNLFQSHIYDFFLPDKGTANAFRDAYNVVKLQAIIAICSTIPGYWATVLCIDRIGRRKIQIMGFAFMAAGLFSIGLPYSYWSGDSRSVRIGFMLLYGLTFFFSNFGPNTTTFIVPAELFPARFRTTCHGISGAAGKVGAIIGSIGFLWASQNNKSKENGYPKNGIGMRGSLIILAVISLAGAVVTYFLTPETNGRSLEENEKENHEANGPSIQMHAPEI